MTLRTLVAALATTFAASAASAAVLTATNASFGVFDSSSGDRTLSIAGPGLVTDLEITVDFAKCDDPFAGSGATGCASAGNAYAGETFFYLTSPDGSVTVDLVFAGTYASGYAGSRNVVTFDDQAAAIVGPFLATGTFRPVESLSAFNGLAAAGDWILRVGDNTGSDPLSFFGATLTIDTDGTAVPLPGTLALLGLGLAGVAALRRRG